MSRYYSFSFRKLFDIFIYKKNFLGNFWGLHKSNINEYECFISLSKNNVFFVFFRLMDGQVIYSNSIGMLGYKGKKKKTPLATRATARSFAEAVIRRLKSIKVSIDDLSINLSLFGPVSSLIIKEACKGLYKGGLRFTKIIDKVAVEHSKGITRKKPRRV